MFRPTNLVRAVFARPATSGTVPDLEASTRAVSSFALATVMMCSALGCAGATRVKTDSDSVRDAAPPAFLLGNFEDDYGAQFTVSESDFFQRSRNHYRIVRWDVADQYLIAQNDSLNTSDAGRWTRIDWLKLSGMAPYEWAFCFTAYKAESRAEAERTAAANRDAPLTGCNRFPFSRMKRSN